MSANPSPPQETKRKLNCKFGGNSELKKKSLHLFSLNQEQLELPLPHQFSLRPSFASSIPVYDQGEVGDCTSCACSYALQYLQLIEKKKPIIDPSHFFLYYNGRLIGGWPLDQDTGLSVPILMA
jgi:hypothetical protein